MWLETCCWLALHLDPVVSCTGKYPNLVSCVPGSAVSCCLPVRGCLCSCGEFFLYLGVLASWLWWVVFCAFSPLWGQICHGFRKPQDLCDAELQALFLWSQMPIRSCTVTRTSHLPVTFSWRLFLHVAIAVAQPARTLRCKKCRLDSTRERPSSAKCLWDLCALCHFGSIS